MPGANGEELAYETLRGGSGEPTTAKPKVKAVSSERPKLRSNADDPEPWELGIGKLSPVHVMPQGGAGGLGWAQLRESKKAPKPRPVGAEGAGSSQARLLMSIAEPRPSAFKVEAVGSTHAKDLASAGGPGFAGFGAGAGGSKRARLAGKGAEPGRARLRGGNNGPTPTRPKTKAAGSERLRLRANRELAR